MSGLQKRTGDNVKDWDADLSEVEVGDWIATVRDGWARVGEVQDLSEHIHPIFAGEWAYTINGKLFDKDVAPSAFVKPPQWLLDVIGPKPDLCPLCESRMSSIRIVSDIVMCDSCAEKAEKFKALTGHTEHHLSESDIVGYDDEGEPLRKGDRVLVWNDNPKINRRNYFKKADGDDYLCYSDGTTEWSSYSPCTLWLHARKVKGLND